MSSIRVSGNTSGYYDLTVPDVAGQNTIPLDRLVTTDASGNLGIGTTSPDLKLHVDGTNGYPATSGNIPVGHIAIRAKNESSSHGGYIGVADAPPWGTWIQAQDIGNLATNYPLSLNPNGGNVGIGTSNPNKELTVNGNAHVGGNSSSIPNTSLASNLDFLQVGASTFIQAGADAQAFIKSNNYWNGSGTSYVNTSYGSTTVRLNENNDGRFQIETASNSGAAPVPRLIINNAGVVTTPYQPSASVKLNNDNSQGGQYVTIGPGGTLATSLATIKFETTVSNTGGHYSTSTGRFTCPVDGKYFVTFNSNVNMGSATGNTFPEIHLNNSLYIRAYDSDDFNQGAWCQQSITAIIPCSANDYLEIKLRCNSGYAWADSDTQYTQASFMLL